MFIQTDEGKLQNLYLLQDVRVVQNDDETYSIGYVQINGEILKELSFETEEEAELKRQEIIAKLLAQEV